VARASVFALLLAAACRNEDVTAKDTAPLPSASAAAPRPSASVVLSEREKFDVAHLRQTTRAGPSVLLAPAQIRALAVGNGWGCAALRVSMSENVMQCWTLGAHRDGQDDPKTPTSIPARIVRWLPASAFAAGDRLCSRTDGQERCWPAAEFFAARPADVPEVWTWPAWKSLMDSPSVGEISADFFTCGLGERIECKGRSRDGFFGSGASCTEETKRAWPGEHGPIAAPKAGCADAPTAVPGLARVRGLSSWSAGPRGVCATDFDRVSRCVGAIPRPPAGTTQIAVGTGDEPNACGILDDGVVCWGGRYSPASSPRHFVRIALAEPAASGAPVVDSPGTAGERCQVHRPCLRPFGSLSACRSGDRAAPWSEVVREGTRLQGKRIRVAGRLFVGAGSGTMMGCGRLDSVVTAGFCCNSSFYPLVVVSEGRTLRIEGLDCHGDESRACCNFSASGEHVIATGTLEEDRGPSGWVLQAPELCTRPE
jgi:hypothetical protein